VNEYPYEFHLLLRIVLAILCGSLIGYERERHGISAGLRTNLLVCAGACLIMIISKYFFYMKGEYFGSISIAIDPERIAAQIVTGIGFLGAGVIIQDKGAVRGLTTAATLWFNAGVGMAIGVGMIIIPVFCTIIGFIALSALKKLHSRIPREIYKNIIISCLETDRDSLSALTEYFNSKNLKHNNIDVVEIKIKNGIHTYNFMLKCDTGHCDVITYLRELSTFKFIREIKIS